jgi:hypothetical protein
LVNYSVKANPIKGETDANKITLDPLAITHAGNIRKSTDILSEALYNLQQQKYPFPSANAADVKEATKQVDPGTLTFQQKEEVKGFFIEVAKLLEKMN